MFAVLALFSTLFLSLVAASSASAGRGSGSIDVNSGDQATGPNPGVTTPAPAATTGTSSGFSDVPAGFWAATAINTVAGANTWMRDYGARTFKPATLETRELFAKAIVQAFDPNGKADPSLHFADVEPDDPNASYIAIAVENAWMLPSGNNFQPTQPVTTLQVHHALIWALGLADVVAGANKFHTTNGYVFKHSSTFGTRLIGAVLGLRYNHSDESMDVGPGSRLNRAEVAWSLYRAYVIDTSQTWEMTDVRSKYKNLYVGPVPPAFRPVIEYGMKFVGYPYIYAGEWNVKSPPGYCCGFQPRGGFDCSGLMWWVLRAGDSLYDAAKYHPAYPGYILNERSSNDMAHAIPVKSRLTWDEVRAGDLLFYGSGGTVSHVDLDIGWGWALDSGDNGVSIVQAGEKGSWYQQTFQWGRQPVPASS